MQLFGIRLVGINEVTGHKLLLTLILIAVLALLGLVLGALIRALTAHAGARRERVRFWARQGRSLLIAVVGLVGVLSIWFDNPSTLTTGIGLVTAGLAFALQKVVTSLAGYFVILRGKNFTVGDRITMGGVRGVRGDVVALGFIQTTIMEMGQPPACRARRGFVGRAAPSAAAPVSRQAR